MKTVAKFALAIASVVALCVWVSHAQINGTTGRTFGTTFNVLTLTDTGPFGSYEQFDINPCETSFGATTVNTGSATTTTGVGCVIGNSAIDAVVYRVTTAITTASSFTVGITGSTSKFCSTQSTLTLGATGVCTLQNNSGITFTGSSSVSAVITFNTTPGAGAIRVIVYSHFLVPPTS